MKRSERLRDNEDEGEKKRNVGLNKKWMEAAIRGDAETVKEMLKDERVDVQYQDGYPVTKNALEVASKGGHADVVRALLEDGRIDPSHGNNYAFRHAAENGHLEVVQWLHHNRTEGCTTEAIFG